MKQGTEVIVMLSALNLMYTVQSSDITFSSPKCLLIKAWEISEVNVPEK